MSFGRAALLVLALILLATQYSFASYSGSIDDWTVPYYGNQQTFCIDKPKPTCIAEGGDCSTPLSSCCSGLKCRPEFWHLGKRYYDDTINSDYGNESIFNRCIEEGRSCQQSYSHCCSGMKCRCPFLHHNCRCQTEYYLYNNK